MRDRDVLMNAMNRLAVTPRSEWREILHRLLHTHRTDRSPIEYRCPTNGKKHEKKAKQQLN